VWLRVVFFLITYGVLCAFLLRHVNKIEKNPSTSLTFELDEQKRSRLEKMPDVPEEKAKKILRAYGIFVGVQLAVLLAIAFVRAISGLAVPILAASFLIGGIACGLVICDNKKDTFRYLLQGVLAMAPAVIMIGIASSVRLVLEESGITESSLNGDGIVIAVIDTEFDSKHEFLTMPEGVKGKFSKEDVKAVYPYLSAAPYVSEI